MSGYIYWRIKEFFTSDAPLGCTLSVVPALWSTLMQRQRLFYYSMKEGIMVIALWEGLLYYDDANKSAEPEQ